MPRLLFSTPATLNPQLFPASLAHKLCPVSVKTNQILEKVFFYRTTPTNGVRDTNAETGLLFRCIGEGWANMYSKWAQSPILTIVKQIDELLFKQLSKVQRLAAAYKNFKLLKVRLFILL